MPLLLPKSVDTVKLATEVSPIKTFILSMEKNKLLSFVSHNDMLCLEFYQDRQHVTFSEVIQNPLLRGGGKNTDTYLFTTLSQLARRYLAKSAYFLPYGTSLLSCR